MDSTTIMAVARALSTRHPFMNLSTEGNCRSKLLYYRCVSTLLPFPYGFQHNLSLISNNDLPIGETPPSGPLVTERGLHEEALDGAVIFVCHLHLPGRTGDAWMEHAKRKHRKRP